MPLDYYEEPEIPLIIPGQQGNKGDTGSAGPMGLAGSMMFPLDPDEPEIVIPIPGPAGNKGDTGAAGTFNQAVIDAEVLSVMGSSVIRKYKAGDKAVNNSAAMQNDDDLFFTVDANTSYSIDLLLHVNCANSGPDFKFDFTGPAASAIACVWNAYTPAGATEGDGALVAYSTAQLCSVNNTDIVIRVRGYVKTAGTSGTLRLRWAQNGAVAVDTLLKAGSWLIAHNQSQALAFGNITPLVGQPGMPGLDAEDPEFVMPIPGRTGDIGPRGYTGMQGPPGMEGIDAEESDPQWTFPSQILPLNNVPMPLASVEFNQQQSLQFRIENRTSDPGAPAIGQVWFRTDL